MRSHVIALLPGFLGFTGFHHFSYFHRRVQRTLENALKDAGHPDIPIYTLDTEPTAGLALRQRKLVKRLLHLHGHHPGAQFHLIGHSTGGVDALFRMLQGETASGMDCTLPEEVRTFWTQANKELKTLQPIQAEAVEPMLPIDDDTNDRIVNTNRQVLRRSGALANTVQCRRLVVGDHLDVAGHFGPPGHRCRTTSQRCEVRGYGVRCALWGYRSFYRWNDPVPTNPLGGQA